MNFSLDFKVVNSFSHLNSNMLLTTMTEKYVLARLGTFAVGTVRDRGKF